MCFSPPQTEKKEFWKGMRPQRGQQNAKKLEFQLFLKKWVQMRKIVKKFSIFFMYAVFGYCGDVEVAEHE